MSRARHKLTGIRHALHNHNTKTIVDSGSNGTDIIIDDGLVGGTLDGDSYIVEKIGGPLDMPIDNPMYGHASDWHDSLLIKVGSYASTSQYGPIVWIYRMLYNVNLFAGGENLNSNTEIKNAVLTLTIGGGNASSFDGGPYNVSNTKLCNIYRNRQTLPSDIDVSYSWWMNWGPLAGNTWGTEGAENPTQDIDRTVSSSFYLLPKADSNYDGDEAWWYNDQVDINITELVQDAVTNRNGLLKTIWIKEDDDQLNNPEENQANATYFRSASSQSFNRPYLTIDWYNP
jgi:hypothetical protein